MKYNLTQAEIIRTLVACNNSKGNRRSQCPMFGKYGNHHCKSNADKQAVKLIEEQQQLIIELKARLEKSVELPCKVGDILYTNVGYKYSRLKNRPFPCKVVFIGLNEKYSVLNVAFEDESMRQFISVDIGKTVFLTQEEAKRALKEREVNV